MGSLFDRMKTWLGLGLPSEGAAPFSLKELPDGRLRFLCISTNNYQDRAGEYFPAASHVEAIAWADKENAYPELWPMHLYGQRLGLADWMDFDGNFLISSGLIDVGMETKARAWANDPETAMSHGFFKRQIGNDIVQYRQFEQSVLPRSMAANPFTDFTLGAKEMALTPEKRAALAEKGYTPDEIAGLDAKTEEFRQKLAGMGVSMKDVEEPAGEPAPAPGAPPVAPSPDTAPASPVAGGFTLDDLRAVIREEVAGATKELEASVKALETGVKTSDDEKFEAMWKARAGVPGTPASKNPGTVVGAGTKEAVAAGNKDAWVGNIPLFQWLNEGGMQGQGVNGQGG